MLFDKKLEDVKRNNLYIENGILYLEFLERDIEYIKTINKEEKELHDIGYDLYKDIFETILESNVSSYESWRSSASNEYINADDLIEIYEKLYLVNELIARRMLLFALAAPSLEKTKFLYSLKKFKECVFNIETFQSVYGGGVIKRSSSDETIKKKTDLIKQKFISELKKIGVELDEENNVIKQGIVR